MNIIEKIFKIDKIVEKKLKEITNLKYYTTSDFSGRYTFADDKTGRSYAKMYTEEIYIYGCVYLISNSIAKLDLRIFKDEKDKNGNIYKKDITEIHPVYKLIKKPNFKDSFYDVIEQVSSNLELTGNAYLLLDSKEKNGIPNSIFCLNSRHVEILQKNSNNIKDISDMISGYKYGNIVYSVDDIIHEKKYNVSSEIYGQSPIEVAQQIVETTREARNRNIAIFSNGMSGDLVFETDSQYNDIVYKRLRQDIADKYQGKENYHMPYILFGGLKLKSIGISQKDLEFIQGMKLTREEICGFVYQVPLILLGILENSSYNNIREATKIFYNFGIRPRLVKIQEMFQKLINLYGIDDAYCEFDLTDIEELRENISSKIDSAQKLFNMGIPLNQIITALNLPFEKVEGGDIGYIPFSMTPIGRTANTEDKEEIADKKIVKKYKLSDDMIEKKWKKFVSVVGNYEEKYKNALKIYFEEQKKSVIANINEFKSMKSVKIGDNAYAIVGEDVNSKKRTINIDTLLFDRIKEVKKLIKIAIPFYRGALKETAEDEYKFLGIDMSFDVSNPDVVDFLDRFALTRCKSVIETLHEDLKEILIEGYNEGLSIDKIVDNLRDAYDKKVSDYELSRIARTEIVGASNHGALFSYQSVGVKKKSWLSAIDERVRDTHFKASSDYEDGILLEEYFKIGNDKMLAPGGGNLPEENINCRCSILPIVD